MIIAAALRLPTGLIITAPPPARHGDLIRAGADAGMTHDTLCNVTQGFLTDFATFVGRQGAHRAAFKAGQIDTQEGELYSEDLW